MGVNQSTSRHAGRDEVNSTSDRIPCSPLMKWVRLLKNLPLRFNEELSEQLCHGRPDGHRWIALSKDISFGCPDDAHVVSIWRFHTFSRGGRRELHDFLELADGCKSLLDVGASTGIFSALFWRSRQGGRVLSVEPDGRSHRLLDQTRQINNGYAPAWDSVRVAVAEQRCRKGFVTSGLGGVLKDAPESEQVSCETLESVCVERAFVPDIVKMDIESFEYEAISGALEWLGKCRPRVFLELHWHLLEQRRLSPARVLEMLVTHGYECRRTKDPQQIAGFAKRGLDGSGCVRLAFRSV